MLDGSEQTTVEVLSPDLEFIRALRAGPIEEAGGRLAPGTPTRVPGAVDTMGLILGHVDSTATGVVGSLIASWLWRARQRNKPRFEARVTIVRWGRRIDISVEGETEAETTALLQAAMDRADLHG